MVNFALQVNGEFFHHYINPRQLTYHQLLF